ncbi:MAG: recombinase RecA [Methylomicrobium sp.]|nr:recombinase RecA [Methylomicrobium sp.]
MSVAKLGAALAKVAGENDTVQNVRLWLDTGFPPLNKAISGKYDGGLPVTRIVEIFGPESSGKTMIATKAMIQAQQMGGIAMFNDHERSFDNKIANRIGLLTDEDAPWIFKTPETFESSVTETIKIAKAVREGKLIDPEAPIVVVYDSLASMVPKSKMAKEVDEQGMNDSLALAKACSAVFPVLAQFAQKYNMLILLLNQTRQKPGVCLRGDVMIPFVDGSSASMKEVVDNRISKDVWSYDERRGVFEPKPIVDWFDNGPVSSSEEWVHVRTTGYGTRNGVKAGTFTLDHKVLERKKGWIKAKDLKVGDQLLSHAIRVINGDLKNFVAGMLFGDSSLRKMGDNRMTAQLCLQDNNDSEYVKWKISKISRALGEFKEIPVSWVGGSGFRYDSPFSHELAEWVQYHRDPMAIMKEFGLSDLALALWVMDDGYLSDDRRYMISLKRIKDNEVLDAIADELYYAYGFRCKVRHREGLFVFDADSTRVISERIARFIPPCVERKVMLDHRGRYEEFDLHFNKDVGEYWETVTSVGSAGKSIACKSRANRYDITVQDNHNFLAGSVSGGFLVHNCYGDPTTTPGGEAPKFYASVRIQLSRTQIKNKTSGEVLGQEITANCIKNKVSAPFRKAKWRFMFEEDGSGKFDVIGSMIDYLMNSELIEKAGTRLIWDGKSYYRAQLAEKIESEDGLSKLIALLPG